MLVGAGTNPQGLRQCRELFQPLYTALDDAMRSGSVPEVTGDPETAPREKAWVLGGCMRFYLKTLLNSVETYLTRGNAASTTNIDDEKWQTELVAGSAKWLEHYIKQSYTHSDMAKLGLCKEPAQCVADMEIEGTPIAAALQTVVSSQMKRLRPFFKNNPAVASMALLVHVQGVASSDAFNRLLQTCSWLRDCILPAL